jgi:hypothetical protein
VGQPPASRSFQSSRRGEAPVPPVRVNVVAALLL